jgi:hypothetical protein
MDFFRNPTSRVHPDLDRHVFIRRPLDPGSPIETDTGKSEHIFQGEIDVARFPSCPAMNNDLFVLCHPGLCKEFLQILFFLPNLYLVPF